MLRFYSSRSCPHELSFDARGRCGKKILEALFFAADEPLTIERVRKILWSAPESGLFSVAPLVATAQGDQSQPSSQNDPVESPAPEPALLEKMEVRQTLNQKISDAIASLREKFSMPGSPVALLEVAGGWQLATNPQYFPWIKRLHKDRATYRLSNPALETLAIVAYKQPITRAEIEDIRGVESIAAIETLLERNLMKTAGRKETLGRPILYATTVEFLRQFGLRSLDEMPMPEPVENSQESSTAPMESLEHKPVVAQPETPTGPVQSENLS